MALGDVAAVTPQVYNASVQVKFTCTFDGTVNTTPVVNHAANLAGDTIFYGVMPCSTCGKSFLLKAEVPQILVSAQQVSS